MQYWQGVLAKKTFDAGLKGAIGRFGKITATHKAAQFFESSGFDLAHFLKQGQHVICDLSGLDSFTTKVINHLVLNNIGKSYDNGFLVKTLRAYLDEASNIEMPCIPEVIAQGRKYGFGLILIFHYDAQFKSSAILEALKKCAGIKIFFRNSEGDYYAPMEKVTSLEKRHFIVRNSYGVVENVRSKDLPSLKREMILNQRGVNKSELRRRMQNKRQNIMHYFTANLDIESANAKSGAGNQNPYPKLNYQQQQGCQNQRQAQFQQPPPVRQAQASGQATGQSPPTQARLIPPSNSPKVSTPSTGLFQRQQNKSQLQISLLAALHFTQALEADHVQAIIKNCTANPYFYISALKKRGWLEEKNALLHLTGKAKSLVARLPFALNASVKAESKNHVHEFLLIRVLVLCLYHLQLGEVLQIDKQKSQSQGHIPDLTIITKTQRYFIEIDTGSQAVKTLSDKIGRYQSGAVGTVIYFTNSLTTFKHFSQHDSVQFIYLNSPSLLADIQRLTAKNSVRWTPSQAGERSAPQESFKPALHATGGKTYAQNPFISSENVIAVSNVQMKSETAMKLMTGEDDPVETD